jgi:hypothetical protein
MLWDKGWFETRAKLLVGLAIIGIFLLSARGFASKSDAGLTIEDLRRMLASTWILVVLFSGMVGGAGIATQPALQATRGLHGSQLFTLALPVSRLRLLAVRSMIGWLELTGGLVLLCLGLWLLFPVVRQEAGPVEMLFHALALIACLTGIYAIPVFLATFLDDQWRYLGSAAISGALWWLLNITPSPASINVFRAMGESSPLLTHEMPWVAMGLSVSVAAALFLLALRIARRREY